MFKEKEEGAEKENKSLGKRPRNESRNINEKVRTLARLFLFVLMRVFQEKQSCSIFCFFKHTEETHRYKIQNSEAQGVDTLLHKGSHHFFRSLFIFHLIVFFNKNTFTFFFNMHDYINIP